ncbi:MAG: hypothetical protein AAF990_25995 [Bacteroidota bacterium]
MKSRIFFLGSLLLMLCLHACNKEEIQPTDQTATSTEKIEKEEAAASLRSDRFDLCDCRMRILKFAPGTDPENLPPFGALAPPRFPSYTTIIDNPEVGVWYDIQLVQGESWRFIMGDGSRPVTQDAVVIQVECPDFSLEHEFVRSEAPGGFGFFPQLQDVVSNCPDCDCTLNILSATTVGQEEEVIVRGQIKQSYPGGITTKFGGGIVELPISVPFEHIGDNDVGLYFEALYYDEEENSRYPVTSITFDLNCGSSLSNPQTITVGSVDEQTPIPFERNAFVTDDCVVTLDEPCECSVSVDKIAAQQNVNTQAEYFSWSLNSPNEKPINLFGRRNTIYPRVDNFKVLPNSSFLILMSATLFEEFPAPPDQALSMQVTVTCGSNSVTKNYLFGSSIGQKFNGSTYGINYTLEEGCYITDTEPIF